MITVENGKESPMANPSPRSFWDKSGRFVVWIVLPLAVGIALASLVPRPVVGLIYLDRETRCRDRQ